MSENTKHILPINEIIILDDKSKFWMLSSGSADVFYYIKDDQYNIISKRLFLFSVKKGELIFPLVCESKKNIELIIVSKDCTVIEIEFNKIFDLDKVYLKNMFDKWIEKILLSIELPQNPRNYLNIEETKTTSIEPNTAILPIKGVFWGSLKQGALNIINDSNFPWKAGDYLLLNRYLWSSSIDQETQIEVINTYQLLNDLHKVNASLTNFSQVILELLENNFSQTLKIDSERFEKKNEFEQNNLSKGLNVIASIVGKKYREDDFVPENEIINHDLFNACKKIANEDGYKLIPPKYLDSYHNNTANQLFAIAQTSNLRIRKVILRSIWWKDDNGHLLAFTKDSKKPVALIQKSSGQYYYQDEANNEIHITHENSELFEPIAYMLFYGFSQKIDSIKKLVSLGAKGLKKDGIYIILAALAASLLGLLVPVMSGIMFDDVIPDADRSYHVEIFAIMLVIGIVSAGLQLMRGVFQLRFETKSSLNLQSGVMDHLLRLPVNFYKDYSSGDLTNRVLSINSIKQVLSNTVVNSVLSGAFSIVNLFLLFYYQSSLAWIGVILAVVAIAFILIVGLNKLQYDREISDLNGKIQGKLFEFLSGITKIKITGGEKRIFSLWAIDFSNFKRLGFYAGSKQNYVEVFNSSFPLFTNIVFFAVIYYLMLNATTTGAIISVGAFMAFISAFNQFLRDCLGMCFSLVSSLKVVTLYERVKPVLEAETETEADSTDPGELSGSIEMNGISFRYDKDQPLVLNHVSFKINPGEMVAFVGPSGSGKSTIMRLLLGFEKPELGSIYYDGDNFDNMSKELVRKQIGVVLQNGALMSGSIFQNIIGNSELTLDDAWEAAKMAGMEEDIKQMPMQMHTVISEGAGTFSGGQRQRLMIARAIVHKPRLIFMDEATSALDNRTQTIVTESLDRLKATRIVIAHRLSTIKNADRIFVLDKGQVVEQGNFEELMKKDGVFAELSKRQIT